MPIFPLSPGTVEGNINDAVPSVRYSFDANADDSVSISMDTTSGDLDPFLYLYAPDGSLLERNDDRESGNRNALIALTLTQARHLCHRGDALRAGRNPHQRHLPADAGDRRDRRRPAARAIR